jgi:hypothetical protein
MTFFIRKKGLLLLSILTTMSFVLLLGGCTYIQLKPTTTAISSSEQCRQVKFTGTPLSKVEQNLLRNRAVSTGTQLLETDYGSPDKYLTVYRTGLAPGYAYTLVFHFIDKYDFDLLRKPQTISLDQEKELHLDIVQDDASETIGEASDQYFWISCTPSVFTSLASSRVFNASVEHIRFQIPYECREEWRVLAGQ